MRLFSTTTWINWFLTAASLGYYLYLVYSGKSLFDSCKDGIDGCVEFHFKWWQKLIWTIVVVVILLVYLCAYFKYVSMCARADWCPGIASVIGKYVDQLDSENDTWSRQYQPAKAAGASTYEPTYYPQQAQEVNQGLLNPNGSYPYTDQQHSFGSRV